MKKIIFITLGIVLTLSLWGQVDKPELDSVDFSDVEFRSYEGPHQKIDTITEIRGIGLALARWDDSGEGRYFNKYRILHLVDSEDPGVLDADILILDATAGVDHIDNLRRIISAYLEGAYKYSQEDADLLSRFVTYYNAVYRGRGDILSERYTSLVNRFLNPEKIGLATSYEEWPGKSEIVIPLTSRGGIGALETDALTDPDVVESLREGEDRGIDERKAITDLKEREIQEEEKAIEEDRQALEEREIAVQEEKELIQQQEGGQPAEKAAEVLEDREEALSEDSQALEERKEKLADRLEQIRQEREQIAEDEGALIDDTPPGAPPETPPGKPEGIPFMTFSFDTGERLGRLVLADATTGAVQIQSSLDNIRTPTFTPFSGGYLLIAGENAGNRIVSLVMLDRESLGVVKSATEKVSKIGGIFSHGDSIYTVVERDGRWVPGRFDKNLVLTGVLDKEAAEYSFFGFNEGHILYQEPRGRVGSAPLSDFSLP